MKAALKYTGCRIAGGGKCKWVQVGRTVISIFTIVAYDVIK